VFFLAEEVRPCAVWAVHESGEKEAPESGQDREAHTARGTVAQAALSSDFLLAQGCAQARLEACQRACLAHGYHGFELRPDDPCFVRMLSARRAAELRGVGRPRDSNLFADCAAAGSSPKAKQTAASQPDGAASAEGSLQPPPVVPGAVRQFHFLETALVRIGLQAFTGMDSFPGADALVLRGQPLLAECRQRCLEGGFGGFAMYRGAAYFRSAAPAALRGHLRPTESDTVFYVLETREVTADEVSATEVGADGRVALLRALLPRLWSPTQGMPTSHGDFPTRRRMNENEYMSFQSVLSMVY